MAEKDNNSNQKEKPKHGNPDSSTSKIFGECIGAVIGIIVMIWLVPKFSFVTTDYQQWLSIGISAAILSAIIKIAGYLINLPRAITASKIGALLVSIWSTYSLLQIFPFDFSTIGYANLNAIVQLALTIALWAMALAVLINIIKFLSGSSK